MAQQKRGRPIGSSAPLVLLIDADADSRTVYRLVLEHSGYAVLAAEDGEDGVRLARERQPAVIITEFNVPGIDGEMVIRTLRADEETKDVCIIVVTTRVFEEARVRAKAAGCTSFLTKPLEPKRLLREIETLFDEES